MFIFQNAEGVHGQRKVGNPCPSIPPLFCFQIVKFLFANYIHTCFLIILFFMTFGHSKLVRQQKSINRVSYRLPTTHFCFTTAQSPISSSMPP